MGCAGKGNEEAPGPARPVRHRATARAHTGESPMQDHPAFQPPRPLVRLLQLVAVLGGLALAAGLAWTPQRAWANVLLVSNYLLGLGLGGLVVIAFGYVSGARWSVPLRRVPEALPAL